MMAEKRKVYLICGVSGAGKSWVCGHLVDKFHWVPHDEYFRTICEEIVHRVEYKTTLPIITECPFGERPMRDSLVDLGFEVIPVFVIEDPDLIAERYYTREGKPIQKAAYTRASSIIHRAQEWGAFYGTSQEVLEHLAAIA